MIALGNYFCLSSYGEAEDRSYLVETKRLVDELKKDNKTIQDEVTDFDHARYPHIVTVSPFDANKSGGGDYVVEDINGTLCRIVYKKEKSYSGMIYMNIGFGVMLVITVLLFILIQMKVVRPFSEMERLSVDLANGHLSMPVHE